MKILELLNVSKFYKSKETVSVGMQNVSLSFEVGEFVAITGESGSGKSTLLNVISGLDGYEEGELFHYGEETSHYTISDWETYRSAYIGFVFQNYNIIDSYTVLQNVMFALEMQGYNPKERKRRALELIEKVGLSSHKNHKASKLSGGQKQRAVIARALAKDTPIIVADEPTGNLDSQSAKEIMKLLFDLSKDKLVIVVTHDYSQVEKYATRKIKMHDGNVSEDLNVKEHESLTEPIKLKAKKVSYLTLLKISLRNIFSTPKRTIFMLFLQILVIGIFTIIYSGQVKTNRETGLQHSQNYPNMPMTRLLVEKRDGTDFTSDDILELNKNKNVLDIYENTHLFFNSIELQISNNRNQSVQNIKSTDSAIVLKKRDIDGSIPKEIDEVVVSSQYGNIKIGDVIRLKVFSYYYYDGDEDNFIKEFKVTGIDKLERDTIYFSEKYLKQNSVGNIDENIYNYIKRDLSKNLTASFKNSFYYVRYDEEVTLTYDLETDKKASDTYTIFNNEMVTFHSEHLYSTAIASLIVSSVAHVDFPNSDLLRIKKDLYDEVIDMMIERFKNQYETNNKLVVAEVATYKNGDNFIKTIDSNKYKVYYPANISTPFRDVLLFIQKLMSGILLFFVGMFLYSIVHAVSKNVMAARKKDFAIFRSIGTNQKTLAQMVVLEQVVMNMFGFFVTLILLFLLKDNISMIASTLPYMNLSDYLVLALILLLLGIWLGLRFNKKIFNQSVIEVLTLSKEEF